MRTSKMVFVSSCTKQLNWDLYSLVHGSILSNIPILLNIRFSSGISIAYTSVSDSVGFV